jgi:hypothetical protein
VLTDPADVQGGKRYFVAVANVKITLAAVTCGAFDHSLVCKTSQLNSFLDPAKLYEEFIFIETCF